MATHETLESDQKTGLPAPTSKSQRLVNLVGVLALGSAPVGALSAVVATSSSAIAQDSFASSPSPAHNWTGLYVGGHVGGARSNNNWFFPSDSINSVAQEPTGTAFQASLFPGPPPGLSAGPAVAASIANNYQGPTVGPFNVSSGSNTASSFLVGAQIGYNYQFGNWVLGVEGEASWTNLKGSNVDPNYSITNHTDTDFLGVLAGRFGYAWDRVLLYGKAGGAWAHDNYSVYTNSSFTVGGQTAVTVTPGTKVDAASVNRFGYMLGAGVEYALSPQWSVKAEYQYLDFGTQRTTLTPTTTVVSPIDMDITQRIQIAKVGINYKLDPELGAALASTNRFQDVRRVGPTQRFYGGAEYLLWWVKGAPLSVPLVTTGPDSTHEGIISSSETTILYGAPFAPGTGGNDTQNFKASSGVRLSFGYWLDDSQRLAIEAGGFVLRKAEADYNVSSDSSGNPGISVPMYNSFFYLGEGGCAPGDLFCGTAVGEDRAPIASAGDCVGGSVAIRNTLQLWGLHANAVVNVIRTPTWEVSALGGFRFLSLNEDFNMYTAITGVSGTQFAGQSGNTDDDFATRNHFYGALLGLRARAVYGPFSLETTLTAALGANNETISINGIYNAYNFYNTTGPYGMFATPANSGTTSSNRFAVVPEAQIKLGYDITPSLKVTVGYDFLYWSNVVRPTDQIDRNMVKGESYQQDPNSTSLAYPQRLNKTTDFYAQGVSVGLTARF
jgi:opacity protein-like surface antigen